MLITKLHTPEGIKDYLPSECEIKNNIELNITKVFKNCGFRPVSTPTIEYAEVFDTTGGIDSKRTYRFVDRDGTLLSLRPDVTPSIARIAATENNDVPKKLYYTGTTFRRNESYQGKLREFTQAGIEIMGSKNSLGADVEALYMAVKALKSVGVENFKIDIGHAEFLTGVLEEAKISDKTVQDIKDCILNKNYVAVSEIADTVENKNISDLLKDLPLLIGEFDIIETAKNRVNNEKSLNALDYLSNVYTILKTLGYEKYISFDLSVIGAMDYYTGIIFRGYARGTGFSVLDGGRYDNMVSQFGKDVSAVGFAVKINDLIEVANIESTSGPDILVVYDDEYIEKAFIFADNMREKGFVTEISELGNDFNINKEYAKDRKISVMCHIGNEIKYDIVSENDNTKAIIENLK